MFTTPQPANQNARAPESQERQRASASVLVGGGHHFSTERKAMNKEVTKPRVKRADLIDCIMEMPHSHAIREQLQMEANARNAQQLLAISKKSVNEMALGEVAAYVAALLALVPKQTLAAASMRKDAAKKKSCQLFTQVFEASPERVGVI